jgi:predicted kinase
LRLIVMTGLPGCGKSTIAEALGRELSIPVFAKDWLEASLRVAGLHENPACRDRLGWAGYQLLYTLASRQLALGQSVILDSAASFESIRERWRNLANEYKATWHVIECTCSDETLHAQRLNHRQRNIPGWYEFGYEEVVRVRKHYQGPAEPRLTLDSVHSLDDNIRQALAYITEGQV